MAKFIYCYNREPQEWRHETHKIKRILGKLSATPYQKKTSKELLWVSDTSALHVHDFNLTLGNFSTDKNQFTFRLSSTEEDVTIETDLVASRTVWYYQDPLRIIVSSSQRAIISILNNFHPNEQAISWMLCTGSLGQNSWDARLKPALPAKCITFSKTKGSTKSITSNCQLSHDSLENIFEQVFDKFIPTKYQGITLSGGWDSRAIAFFLRKHQVPTFSWGSNESIKNKASDSYIAREVARDLNLDFTFIGTDQSKTDASSLNTFIEQTEGRIDHINSFADGLNFWKQISEKGISEIIRADEAFGWLRVHDEKDSRISLDLNLPSDYQNINEAISLGQLPLPKWPNSFKKNRQETLANWRDRIYRDFRIPYVLAALQEPMLSYTEIKNPFFHQKFISWILTQPDRNRTEKKSYKDFLKRVLPDLPFASIPAIPEIDQVLSKESFQEKIRQELLDVNSVLNPALRSYLVNQLTGTKQVTLEKTWKSSISNFIPFRLKKALRKSILHYKLGGNRLAFRGYIISVMIKILQNDTSNA